MAAYLARGAVSIIISNYSVLEDLFAVPGVINCGRLVGYYSKIK